MQINQFNREKVLDILNQLIEGELAGVVRYTHYSLMVSGPYRLPIVQFLQAQATESLQHAQEVGEILTGLDGHPSLKISPMNESNRHSIRDILEESLAHEELNLGVYIHLLHEVEGKSIMLEEFARTMIGTEERHSLELRKMLRDFSQDA